MPAIAFAFLSFHRPTTLLPQTHNKLTPLPRSTNLRSLTAFADDILLIMLNPHVILANLMYDLQEFGILSRYPINMNKSQALPL